MPKILRYRHLNASTAVFAILFTVELAGSYWLGRWRPTCARTKTSKVPTRVALLYLSYSVPRLGATTGSPSNYIRVHVFRPIDQYVNLSRYLYLLMYHNIIQHLSLVSDEVVDDESLNSLRLP